jgi:peroxin-1
LNAIADSLDLSPDVDLADLAAKTTNMSGADLQALVYNAHLDVVHSTIRDKPSQLNGSSEKTSEEQKRTFRQIAPKLLDSQVVSVADRAEMELKVGLMFTKWTRMLMRQLENILANANRSIKTAPVLSADLPEVSIA